MQPPSERDLALDRALSAAGRCLERVDGACWRVVVANGSQTTLHVHTVADEWLAVTAPLPQPVHAEWSLLRENARLGGCARIVRAEGGLHEVRAEIFLGGEDEAAAAAESIMPARLTAACADVVSAIHAPIDPSPEPALNSSIDTSAVRPVDVALLPRHDAAPDVSAAAAEVTSEPPLDSGSLVALCADAGWTATVRASGEVQVPLDTRAAGFVATLSIDQASRLHAAVPLTASPLSGASQEATARLLLGAGAEVRTVKGITLADAGIERAGIAIATERLPLDAPAVDRALSALSIACDIVGREAQALQDLDLAREYLALFLPRPTEATFSLPCSHQLEDTPCLQLP